MNTIRLLLTLSLVSTTLVMAAEKTATPSRVEVSFTDPEKFTDVKDSWAGTDKGRDAILAEIRDHITQRAERFLPEGQRLQITFSDVDLAGDYEPWRGPRLDDVRIVKDIYPPRLDFTFRVTDAGGAVVREGKKELRDLAFQTRLTLDRNDPLRYEKDMLNDWLRSEFRKK